MEFIGCTKMARWSRDVIITEKIDGTQGQICIEEAGEHVLLAEDVRYATVNDVEYMMRAGSKNQWVGLHNDNHGFANWAFERSAELIAGLGAGRHFGEWWGSGIQRGYGLTKGEKRFSLFNVQRWCLFGHEPAVIPTGDPRVTKLQSILPECVGLVPIIWRGNMDDMNPSQILADLLKSGSHAAPGFDRPEGIVIHHVAGNVSFKKTCLNDNEPKSKVRSQEG